LVRGLFLLSQSNEPFPVNLGNPQEMTIREFAESIRKAVGTDTRIVHEPLPEDDPKRRQPDIGRARALLAWEPSVTLEEGIAQTIAYFRSRAGRSAMPVSV
jgi:dTDP-glucose 4,6-dehydratase